MPGHEHAEGGSGPDKWQGRPGSALHNPCRDLQRGLGTPEHKAERVLCARLRLGLILLLKGPPGTPSTFARFFWPGGSCRQGGPPAGRAGTAA